MSKKDLKEGLSSARKADITHMRTPFLVYGSRACEYGDQKYERATLGLSSATYCMSWIRWSTTRA